jgi:hypothetical protein
MANNKGGSYQELEAGLKVWGAEGIPRHLLSGNSATNASQLPLRTEHSATVFSGEAGDWIRYLACSPESRYERGIGLRVYLQPEHELLAFEAESPDSEWLAEMLRAALHHLRQRTQGKPHVRRALHELLFANGVEGRAIRVLLSPNVPSTGTLEVAHPDTQPNAEMRLVLHSAVVRRAQAALYASPGLDSEQRLGLCWPVISRLVSQLAYPTSPRDRFVAKIDTLAKVTFVALNVLYEGRKSGQLLPCFVGSVYEEIVSAASDIPRASLAERHPYFRMLTKLGFMLRENPYASYSEEAKIAAREFLDTSYLRLSLSGAMPDVAPAMRAMSFERKRDKIRTPSPVVGQYGILDDEDRSAWKKVDGPFQELGFVLIRQTGMGDFGRVYEAINQHNSQFPERVALKVDRIIGKKRQAILEAEAAMVVGRDLASAPHLIRLYDTGKLHRERYTFHVLQLIEGDTLDSLVGAIGKEHASVSRPPQSWNSVREAEAEFRRAVAARQSESWREKRMGMPFRYALSPTMVLDLLTSVLLTLEEVHRTGYAINDLKNDNLMMNRRGQIKGIDLDSYGPVRSPLDKATDFMFLAASLLLIVFNAPTTQRYTDVPWEELTESSDRLRAQLEETWPFGDVNAISAGRVQREELATLVVDLVLRSRQLVYARDPDVFSADIVRLIRIKRRLLVEEMVID